MRSMAFAGLMTLDAATTGSSSKAAVEGAWHAAQGYHFWMLAHRQLYGGQTDAAMRTALNLRKYVMQN